MTQTTFEIAVIIGILLMIMDIIFCFLPKNKTRTLLAIIGGSYIYIFYIAMAIILYGVLHTGTWYSDAEMKAIRSGVIRLDEGNALQEMYERQEREKVKQQDESPKK
jgi:hypothetical protein